LLPNKKSLKDYARRSKKMQNKQLMRLTKPMAKQVFFNCKPLIIAIPRADFYKEVQISGVRKSDKSKTDLFNELVDAVFELAKEECMYEIKPADITFAMERYV
jgi:hypothetical protein